MRPGAMPAWALVKRELLRGLRKKRSFLLHLAAAGVSASLIYYAWPSADGASLRSPGVGAASFAAQRIVRYVAWVLWGGCVLCVPAMASAAIVSEREEETFDLLLTSLVRPFMVALTKGAVVVAWYALVAVAVVPVMATVLYLSGLDFRELINVWIAVGSLAALLAAAGVLASSLARSSFQAVLLSYGFAAFLLAGPPILAVFTAGPQVLSSRLLNEPGGVTFTFPLYFFLGVLEGNPSEMMVATAAGTELAGAAGLLWLATRAIRRDRPPRRIETEKPIDDPAVLKQRRAHFPFYLIDPLKRKRPVEDGRNPVFVREIRWGFQNRQTLMIRAFYLLLIVYFIYGAASTVGTRAVSPRALRQWALGQIMLPLFIAPALLPNAISREIAREQLDFLRSTLLGPFRIIAGKAMAGFVLSIPLYIALAVSLLVMKFIMRLPWTLIGQSLATCLVFCLVALAVGLCASLMARRGPVSVILSYLGTFLILGGALFIAEKVAAMIWGFELRGGLFEVLNPGRALVEGNPWQWALSLALFTCLSGALFAGAAWRFRRYRVNPV